MPVEISPEPTPEEREALLRALVGLDRAEAAISKWWTAGAREALGESDEDQFPVERP